MVRLAQSAGTDIIKQAWVSSGFANAEIQASGAPPQAQEQQDQQQQQQLQADQPQAVHAKVEEQQHDVTHSRDVTHSQDAAHGHVMGKRTNILAHVHQEFLF